jgi:hypothetical protein
MPTESAFNVRGTVTLWRIDEKTGLKTQLIKKSNQIQVGWGFIAAKQLGFRPQSDHGQYFISGMYFEYENLSDPEQPIAVPEFARTVGAEYYTALAAPKDFIRVPLRLEPTIGIAAGSEGAEVLQQAGHGNQLTFFAQTSGNGGFNNGQYCPFSHTANSKIYSAALVAMPAFEDQARDIVFARTNFDIGDQTSKEASSQIGITWDIAFE